MNPFTAIPLVSIDWLIVMQQESIPNADHTVSDPPDIWVVSHDEQRLVVPLRQLAEQIGAGSGERLLLRLAGSAVAVRAQRVVAEGLGDARPVDPAVWNRLRVAEPASANVVRLSRRRTELARLWRAASAVIRQAGGAAHASLDRGIVRCWIGGSGATALAALDAFEPDDVCIVERLTSPADVPLAGGETVARALRAEFDPARVLNRGILGREAT